MKRQARQDSKTLVIPSDKCPVAICVTQLMILVAAPIFLPLEIVNDCGFWAKLESGFCGFSL